MFFFNLLLITSQLRYTHIFFLSLVLVFLWSLVIKKKNVFLMFSVRQVRPHRGGISSAQPHWETEKAPFHPRPLRLLLALQQGSVSRSFLCLRKINWTTSDTDIDRLLDIHSLISQRHQLFFQANENSAWHPETISSLIFSCTEGETGCKWRWKKCNTNEEYC